MSASLLRVPRLPQGGQGLAEAKAEADRTGDPAAGNDDMDAEDRSREDGLCRPHPRRGAGEQLEARCTDGRQPGKSSRRVAQLEGVIRKARKGREVLISLH